MTDSNKDDSLSSYQRPSPLLERLMQPQKNPSLTLSSNQQWIAFADEPPLPSISDLAQPEEKLAGLRFHPELLTRSRLEWATGLTLQHLETGHRIDVPMPENAEGIRYIRFNPKYYQTTDDSDIQQEFVLVCKVKDEKSSTPRLELHRGQLTGRDAGSWRWSMTCMDSLLPFKLNLIQGCPFQFTSDGNYLLVDVVPQDHPSEPPPTPLSVGPAIQQVRKGARKAPGRTYQDLLQNQHDQDKLKYYVTTEVVKVPLEKDAGDSVQVLPQSVGGCLFQSFSCSPNGRFLLVQRVNPELLSYSVPYSRFGKIVELWDLHCSQSITVASLPVDDEIPLSYDACSRHVRRFRFHPLDDSTILYAHALDGGDPAREVEEGNFRDALYTRNLQVDDDDDDSTMALGDPIQLVGLEWRYDDVEFTESGLIVVDEYRWKDRMERKWKVASDGNKTLVWERSWEDRYTSPGAPVTRLGPRGQSFIVEPEPRVIFLKGAGASPLGDRPFLDRRRLDTGASERLWRCKAPKEGDIPDLSLEVGGVAPTDRDDVFESVVILLPDNERVLMSRESKTTPRNYYLTSLKDLSDQVTVTTFPHPQVDLLGVTKELVTYERNDGVTLTANLYLPKDYDGTPRPTLFWAYPREFKNSKAAGQVKGSKHRFVSASWASPVHWAAKGWVIMDDFALPVIGEGDAQPNDNFVDQIVSGATAAVEYVTKRGVCDPAKCAVGGHSYGSFMTSHLLSHTSLFAAGIGRSGAFNRTLTPMSFQSEDRSMWEAPDTYINMSPLMHVEKYSKQDRVGKLLLIHGKNDENSGTHPMQSERYFSALKAFGIESRLCMLPHERHSYRAKESILHMAWEQETWLASLEE